MVRVNSGLYNCLRSILRLRGRQHGVTPVLSVSRFTEINTLSVQYAAEIIER